MVVRIPFVRFGDDSSPYEWWEWLVAPIVLPLFFIALFLAGAISIPISYVYLYRRQRDERLLMAVMKARGRWVDWRELEEKWLQGYGTLIIEHDGIMGPSREWWTADDVLASSPIPVPSSWSEMPSGLSEPDMLAAYARFCADNYVDLDSGIALITEIHVSTTSQTYRGVPIPPTDGKGMLTAAHLEKGDRPLEHFPNAKLVTLLNWGDHPYLMIGEGDYGPEVTASNNRHIPLTTHSP